jgi:hypothetical protein
MRRIILALVATALSFAGVGMIAPPAQAYTAQQCIDAHTNPQGAVATWCHQNGWTVNAYIVVDPGSWVRWGDFRYMRQCGSENGGPNYPCWWNFWQPPSSGAKFWYDIGGHIHYVNGLNL